MSYDLCEQIIHILSQQTQLIPQSLSLKKLAGEASYREYYRIEFEDGKSLILMKMPQGYSSISEEVTKVQKEFCELPFINIQKYLMGLKLPVPQIIAYHKEKGILILEDLGDTSLESLVKHANHDQVVLFYKKAIDLLVLLQERTKKNPRQDCMAYYKKFDEDLLKWESNHFLEYGIEDRFQIQVNQADKKLFQQVAHEIVSQIIQMPLGFVHRDFQSRNIMVDGNDFKLIDFQDALLGPQLYDLVSLLRDSYVELSENTLEILIRYYGEKVDEGNAYHPRLRHPPKVDQLLAGAAILRKDFDLITIQRKLKDAGRFQYIHTVKKNSNFLKHMPNSLKYVKQALTRCPEYQELETLLKRYLPEFH